MCLIALNDAHSLRFFWERDRPVVKAFIYTHKHKHTYTNKTFKRLTFMPPEGFKPTVSAIQLPQAS